MRRALAVLGIAVLIVIAGLGEAASQKAEAEKHREVTAPVSACR